MVGDRRFGVGPFLGIWLVLVGLQGAMIASGLPKAAIVACLVLLQLAKIWPTALRLNDVGRRPSEALILVLIPLANAYGFVNFCLGATPAPGIREARRSKWIDLMDWSEALFGGAKLAIRTAAVGLPLSVLLGVTWAVGGRYALQGMEWCSRAGPDTVALAGQVLGGASGFLFLYTVVQYTKRHTATRASWFPSLFLLPMIMVVGALTMHSNGMGREMGPVMMMLFQQAWYLLWSCTAGSAVAVGWVLSGEAARKGESISPSELVKQIAARTLDVAAAHGGVKHAVTVGIQVLIPGVYYAIQFAFVDMVAVLDPERPALKRSAELTWGHRARIFRLLLIWFVITVALVYGIGFALEPMADMQASMFDPRVIDVPTVILQDLASVLTTWVLTLALLLMYNERIEREVAKKAKKAAALAEPLPDAADA